MNLKGTIDTLWTWTKASTDQIARFVQAAVLALVATPYVPLVDGVGEYAVAGLLGGLGASIKLIRR